VRLGEPHVAGKASGEGAKRGALRWLTAPFGLRGLTGFALWGFIFLSVLATGLGFADLRAAGADNNELSALELAFTIATTLFVVSAMVVALHHVVAPETPLLTRILSFGFYLVFAVWSVGFGYGFFWKELAGQEFTERQFESAMTGLSASVTRTSAMLQTWTAPRRRLPPWRANGRRSRRAKGEPAPTIPDLRPAKDR